MKKKLKIFLLCLLSVSAAAVAGNSFADEDFPAPDNSVEEQTEEKSSVAAKLSESVEKVDVPYDDIAEYLEKIGTVDGIDIYFKDKDIDDIIWEKNGGKPDKKSDYTPEQEKLSDKISDIKKLGDFVAADGKTKKVLADFDKGNKCNSGKVYISGGGRYLL